jgi:hypothetical protein
MERSSSRDATPRIRERLPYFYDGRPYLIHERLPTFHNEYGAIRDTGTRR